MNQYISFIFPALQTWNYCFMIDLQFIMDVIVLVYLSNSDKLVKRICEITLIVDAKNPLFIYGNVFVNHEPIVVYS
jgi:hypothetical protein